MIHCLLKSDGNWYLVEFLIIPQGVNFAQFWRDLVVFPHQHRM
jgi:hypothetical protein